MNWRASFPTFKAGFIASITLPLIVLAVISTVLLSTSLPTQAEDESRGLNVNAKTPDGKLLELYKNSYALVIGNGTYQNGWDNLPGATADVKEVGKALKKNGFTVILKTDLTKADFEAVFNEFTLKYGKNRDNRLLFYFAGHGHTQTMANGEELGHLIMVDTPLPEDDLVNFNIKSVAMDYIVTYARLTKAKHVLFMFDCCFSGSILNVRSRMTPSTINHKITLPVRQFITAGSANEKVPDRSVFKQAFLDLLEGRVDEPNPDGYVTGMELGYYLKEKVPQYYQGQHPQYGTIRDIELDKGDFVFVLDPKLFEAQQKNRIHYDYAKAQKSGTKEAYQEFIRKYEKEALASENRKRAQEKIRELEGGSLEQGQNPRIRAINDDWQQAVTANTITACQDFITRYKNDPLAASEVDQAEKRIIELKKSYSLLRERKTQIKQDWFQLQKLKSVQAYSEFLEKYKSEPLAEKECAQATAVLSEIKQTQDRSDTRKSIIDQDWRIASENDSLVAYQAFYLKYQQETQASAELAQAQKKMKELEQIQNRKTEKKEVSDGSREKQQINGKDERENAEELQDIHDAWVKCQRKNTQKACSDFIEKYSQNPLAGKQVTEAQKNMRVLAQAAMINEWMAIKADPTEEELSDFIKKYGSDLGGTNEVKAALAILKKMPKTGIEDDWKETLEDNTEKSYRSFIEKYAHDPRAKENVTIAEKYARCQINFKPVSKVAKGTDIEIRVEIKRNDDIETKSVVLFFKVAKQPHFNSIAMHPDKDEGIYEVMLPTKAMKSDSVFYFIKVEDSKGIDYYSGSENAPYNLVLETEKEHGKWWKLGMK